MRDRVGSKWDNHLELFGSCRIPGEGGYGTGELQILAFSGFVKSVWVLPNRWGNSRDWVAGEVFTAAVFQGTFYPSCLYLAIRGRIPSSGAIRSLFLAPLFPRTCQTSFAKPFRRDISNVADRKLYVSGFRANPRFEVLNVEIARRPVELLYLRDASARSPIYIRVAFRGNGTCFCQPSIVNP